MRGLQGIRTPKTGPLGSPLSSITWAEIGSPDRTRLGGTGRLSADETAPETRVPIADLIEGLSRPEAHGLPPNTAVRVSGQRGGNSRERCSG